MAAALDMPLLQRSQYGAALFLGVAAAHEAAFLPVGGELPKGLRQAMLQFQIQFVCFKGGETGRIHDLRSALQTEQFHMAGGVAAASQRVADLAHLNVEVGIQRVENAGFSNAGVACKGRKLAADKGLQFLQSLPCFGADPQRGEPGGGVDAEGHARKVFDDYGFEYVSVGPKDVREGALDNLDVLYIPDNLMGDLDGSNNFMKEALPEERDWLRAEDEEKLRAFVKGGGKVLAISQAVKYIAKVFDLKITDRSVGHIPPNSFGRMSPNSCKLPHEPWFSTRNSTLRAQVIPSYLTLGMDENCNVVHSNSPVMEIGEYFKPFLYKAYLRYPKKDVIEDGLLEGEEYIAGTPALVGATYGEGEALLYGFNPTFRGWTENTYKTVFNALYK